MLESWRRNAPATVFCDLIDIAQLQLWKTWKHSCGYQRCLKMVCPTEQLQTYNHRKNSLDTIICRSFNVEKKTDPHNDWGKDISCTKQK